MAMTQGDAIRSAMVKLELSGWETIFYSMPNTAHINVVPIPTPLGSSQQRYPDIVATNGEQMLLVEVEPRFSVQVVAEIATRFHDANQALSVPAKWRAWRAAIRGRTGKLLPEVFVPEFHLLVCQAPRKKAHLEGHGFLVTTVDAYSPSSRYEGRTVT